MGFIIFILFVFTQITRQFEQMPKAENESQQSTKYQKQKFRAKFSIQPNSSKSRQHHFKRNRGDLCGQAVRSCNGRAIIGGICHRGHRLIKALGRLVGRFLIIDSCCSQTSLSVYRHTFGASTGRLSDFQSHRVAGLWQKTLGMALGIIASGTYP